VTGKTISLAETYPEQPIDNVTTFDQTSLWTAGYGGNRYNPDDLVQRKGLPIYAKMAEDEQVKAVIDFKLAAILARGWTFEFDEDSELGDEEKELRGKVFKKVIKRMYGSFADSLDAVASGREYGFSITEKVYGEIQHAGKTYVGINKLLTRAPGTFEFKTDPYGELNKIVQKVNNGNEIDVDIDRVIHYVHRPKFDRIFGRSDLRAAYRSWYAKDQLIKLWLLFLEKFAGGIAVAKRVSDEAPSYGTLEYISLENALRNMASTRSVILPKGVELDVLFPSTTDAYEKACVFFDLAIAKSLLVPNLLGLSHTGQTGAYSQSQTQLEAFFWTLGNDGSRLEECLNEQLFRDLGDQNWGDGDYPEFRFKPSSMEHIKWVITTWKDLVGANAVIPTEDDEKRLRELLDMPPREEGVEPLVTPQAQHEMEMAEQQQIAQQEAANADAIERDEKFAAAIAEVEKLRKIVMGLGDRAPQVVVNTAPTNANAALPLGDPSLESNREPGDGLPGKNGGAAPHLHGDLGNIPLAVFNRALERVAFAVIENKSVEIEGIATSRLSDIVAKAVKKALGDEENMQLLVDEDVSDIAEVEFGRADVGALKSTCKAMLDRAWSLGSNHASNEMERSRGATMSADTRRIKFASLRDKAASFFESKSFRMAGDASDQAKRIIQQELQNAVKSGKPVAEVRATIWDRLVGKGLTLRDSVRGVETDDAVNAALDELWVDTEEGAAAYLNTLVRTNTFEALNEARYAEFTDPELGGFVVALRYAAVLDSSTSEICNELGTGGDGDGVIYSADSELWDTYRPPNHYNCRAILVPVTELDGWDGLESEAPSIEPQEGFGA
jgi:SPP1 gp7 family putative phage head morphogenesis protein